MDFDHHRLQCHPPIWFEYDATDYNNNDCEDYAYNYDNNNVDVDDDNSDDSYTSYSSEDGCGSYNTPNIIIEIHGYRFNIDKNHNVISYDDDDNDKPMAMKAAQQQINAILGGP